MRTPQARPKFNFVVKGFLNLILIAGLSFWFAEPSWAGIYSYKDENGAIHFTDDLSKIPKEYRSPETGLKQHSEERPSSPFPEAPTSPTSDLGFPALKKDEYTIPLLPTNGGNFIVETVFNNSARAHLMVDTGASIVTLSEKVAKDMGLSYGPDSPHMPFTTAGGQVWMPVVVLESVKVGDAEVRLVEASVNNQMGDLDGLLGMSFLNDFRVEVDRMRSQMILRSLHEQGEVVWDGKPEAWWRAKFSYYNDRVYEYKKQAARVQVVNPNQTLILSKLARFYEKLKGKLDDRADRFGVPARFR